MGQVLLLGSCGFQGIVPFFFRPSFLSVLFSSLKEKGVSHYLALNYEFPSGYILFNRDNDLSLFMFPPSIPRAFSFLISCY